MSAQAATIAGRTAAESLMVDTCLIEHRTGTSALDETTGRYTDTWTTVYSGKCRIQARDVIRTPTAESGERLVTLKVLTCSVPMSVTGVKVDDRVTVTASALDPDLTNRAFRVADLFHKTHATARRLAIEEITS